MKRDLKEILDYNLKRKYPQLNLARKKKKLEDERKIEADLVEMHDVQHEIVQIETKIRFYNDQLDELADA